MSPAAIALTVIGSVAYLAIGLGAAGFVQVMFMDTDLFGHRWPVWCLSLLAVPLWPLLLALRILATLIGVFFT